MNHQHDKEARATIGSLTVPAHLNAPIQKVTTPAPFIKWAGGKRAIVPILESYFPEKIGPNDLTPTAPQPMLPPSSGNR